jgi:hypothetical protein
MTFKISTHDSYPLQETAPHGIVKYIMVRHEQNAA